MADEPRQAVNLTVDSRLLAEARELGLNLSQELAQALREAVARERRQRWLDENRAAIAAYNRHVEENGVFSDGLRSF